jgi:hypothetical protein
VGWGQAGFYPYLASSLMMKLSEKLFVECYSMVHCLPQILKEEEGLGSHSSVLLFTPLFGLEYSWTSSFLRPFGEIFPVQCPKCFALKSIQSRVTSAASYTLTCKAKCSWRKDCAVKMGPEWRMAKGDGEIWRTLLVYGLWEEVDAFRRAPRRLF